jgi:hypothetical protein
MAWWVRREELTRPALCHANYGFYNLLESRGGKFVGVVAKDPERVSLGRLWFVRCARERMREGAFRKKSLRENLRMTS